ncbi:LPKTxAVK-anchored surface protein [Corynebacterium sanguinis]
MWPKALPKTSAVSGAASP